MDVEDWNTGIPGVFLIELPKVADVRGNLSFIHAGEHIPFDFRRAYYLYDVPAGAERGGHAHKKLEQFIVPLAGSFDVVVRNGHTTRSYTLNRPYWGLYLGPMIWRDLENFSSGAVCLVLASAFFDEDDYIRDFSRYLSAVSN